MASFSAYVANSNKMICEGSSDLLQALFWYYSLRVANIFQDVREPGFQKPSQILRYGQRMDPLVVVKVMVMDTLGLSQLFPSPRIRFLDGSSPCSIGLKGVYHPMWPWVLRSHTAMVQYYCDNTVLWYRTTMVPQCFGIIVLWYLITVVPCYYGTIVRWNHRTWIPSYNGTMEPRYQKYDGTTSAILACDYDVVVLSYLRYHTTLVP